MSTYKAMLVMLGLLLSCSLAAGAADVPKLTLKFAKADVPGALKSYPGGVNNSGLMVGAYVDKNNVYHGYMLKGKTLTTIDDPKGTTSCVNLNPNGPIPVVGNYVDSSNNYHGFVYKNGTFTDIPGPSGATSSDAYGINDAGDIVGDYFDSSGVLHGSFEKRNLHDHRCAGCHVYFSIWHQQ